MASGPDDEKNDKIRKGALTARLLRYVLRHKLAVVCAVASMILAGATETVPIFLAKVFVEDVLLTNPGIKTGQLDRTPGTDVLIETESGPVLFSRSKSNNEVFEQASNDAALKVERRPKGSWAQSAARKIMRAFPESLDAKTAILALVVGIIVLSSLLSAVSTYANEYLAKALATHVVVDLRTEMMRKLLRLPMGYFTRRKLGDI